MSSGDPQADSVVLWTRLAPRPYQPDSGLPAQPVTVQWEIAQDERFEQLAGRGSVTAYPEYHHSVHVEPGNLLPARDYHYRFRVGSWISPVGRTRTAPAVTSRPERLRFGVVSCQAYHHGYFTALKHLAGESLDAVVHLGDYIYEYAVNSAGGDRAYTDRVLPAVFNREAVSLDDYRLRYALYKSDPDLAAAHAAHPWIVTWDDHETENNYAGSVPDNGVSPEEFLIRRAASYRAYWENMPLRVQQRPDGPDMQLYRRLRYGTLAQLDVLDTRQYRSDQASGSGWMPPSVPSEEEASRTMTGTAQEEWLINGWRESDALWNVLPQQVVFSQRRSQPGDDYQVSMDAWDGYPASRERLLAGAESAGVDNLLVLSGDAHRHYGLDIKRDFDDPDTPTVGVEVVTTSVTSGGNGADRPANYDSLMGANPHMKFYNDRRGYVRLTLDATQARADYRTVPTVTTPGAAVTTTASFVTAAGDAGLRPG